MGVDDDAFGFAVGYAEDYAGGLAGCAGDGEKFGHGLRDFVVELLADDAACALNGLGLVVVEAGGADEFFNGLDGGFGHGFRGGIGREELGGDHVDAGVGALGGEDGGDEKLPGGFVDEGALGVGVGFAEDFEDGFDAVGFGFELGCAVAGGVSLVGGAVSLGCGWRGGGFGGFFAGCGRLDGW